MKSVLMTALANVFITFMVAAVLTIPQAAEGKAPKPEDIEAGRELYRKMCAFCHGSEGRGDGPVADYLDPKPRDFTKAEYKIRSTPWGSLPTDEDLFRVVTKGTPGTAMPAWDILPEDQRWQLVYYIKSFSERFAKEGPPEKISMGKEVRSTPQTIARGGELYKKMKCFLCHGDGGRGDGPITETLRYEWGFPFKARNLTEGWRFKGGNSIRDIYRTLSTGLNGTPMGSYADYLPEEQRWALACYVNSLSPAKEEASEVVVKSKFVEGELPDDPNDPQWENTRPIEIPLSGQVIARPRLWTPSITIILVRSLYNENRISFLLEWDDATDRQDELLRDAVSIQFPVRIPEGPEKPYFFMGQPGKIVNIWHWKAGWQGDQDKGKTYVQELNAAGFRKQTLQPFESQDVKGKGVWSNGRWGVVLTRAITTEDKGKDIQFEGGRQIPIAFSVWDGSNGEIGPQNAISSWYYLLLETRRPFSVYVYTLIGILAAVNLELWLISKARRLSPADIHIRSELSKESE